jgi:uncharacterized protein (TIGR03382 family)
MLSKRFMATCGMLAWLIAPAWASTIPDPSAQIDAGSQSNPFSGLGSFNPTGDNGSGIIALYNDTGGLLTSISMHTDIDPGLTYTTVNATTIALDNIDFSCNDANSGNPFFLNCGVTYSYVPGNTFGVLTISFFGVNPYVPPTSASGLDLRGAHEGIPTLLPGCASTPDGPGCTDVGHFAFNFLSLQTNGWTDPSTESAVFLNDTFPTFAPPSYTDTASPEPGTSTLLAAGLLSLAWLTRRNYFSRSSRS